MHTNRNTCAAALPLLALMLGCSCSSTKNDNTGGEVGQDITRPEYVKVENLTLDSTSIEIKEGESVTLTAAVQPEGASYRNVEWTSPDLAVATVTGGVVTGVGAGRTTIVARAGTASATCKVTVKYGDVSEDKRVPLADPFIYYENGIYYLYGTGSDNGIAVYQSLDLRKWTVPGAGKEHLALDKSDSYGDTFFWAPEVYKVGGRYYMYYSADERICAAVSDSPTGPFVQETKTPMATYGSIDNSLFIDSDGKPWLFYVKFNNGNEVWSAELADDLLSIRPGTEKFCLRADAAWEKVQGTVAEGPFVLKHKGKYYLTYSANDYQSPFYGIGYATADSPSGPWTKYSGNPILQKPAGLEGVGHHAFFTDENGSSRIVFHSHNAPGQVQPRVIHIGRYEFGSDGVLSISDEFFTPALE